MSHELLWEAPSQTADPYVHIGLALTAVGNLTHDLEIWNHMAHEGAPGQHILLLGHIHDDNGHSVHDPFLELWQTDSEGRYQGCHDPEQSFNNFGRTVITFDAGEWTLHTIKPEAVRSARGMSTVPHINVLLFVRSINIHLQTRLYLDDEAEASVAYPVLDLIEQVPRRDTLLTWRREVDGQLAYRPDIHIQDGNEMVFFDLQVYRPRGTRGKEGRPRRSDRSVPRTHRWVPNITLGG